jgi:ADP-heptose:LPS heptosyltransferase
VRRAAVAALLALVLVACGTARPPADDAALTRLVVITATDHYQRTMDKLAMVNAAGRLTPEEYDRAILVANQFRAAAFALLAGAPEADRTANLEAMRSTLLELQWTVDRNDY